MERYEFEYNIARMSVTALLNISGKQLNEQLTPSQLWPDWNADHTAEDNEADPEALLKKSRAAIDFLNKK